MTNTFYFMSPHACLLPAQKPPTVYVTRSMSPVAHLKGLINKSLIASIFAHQVQIKNTRLCKDSILRYALQLGQSGLQKAVACEGERRQTNT